MTRLTTDTALNEISHRYMTPIRSTTIMDTVRVTMMAQGKLNPISKKVITKIAATLNGMSQIGVLN